MPDRTCATCGAAVGVLVDRCPSCGGDPDLRLIDLGGNPRRREAAGPRPPAGGRRGWAPLVAAFVAVWGLVAILAGGSAGDRSPAAPDPTPTTDAQRDTTAPRPATTSTTAVVDGAPLVGPPDGLGLVLLGEGSAMLLDLDTGTLNRLGTRGVYGVVGRSLLVEGAGGLELWPTPFDGQGASLLTDTLPMMAWVADGGREIWIVDVSDGGGGGRARLLRPDGEVILTHELRELGQSAWPIGATDGGLIVAAPGGTYLLGDGGGIDRVSTGSPVAASGTTVHVATCDERLDCGVEAVDETGRPLGVRLDGATQAYGIAAPDGRLAYSGPAEGAFRRAVLVDGRVVLEATASDLGAAAWSPDGRWLAVLGPGSVTLVDTFVGTPPVVVEVDRTYGRWQAYFVELS